jgi:hypothetical protein
MLVGSKRRTRERWNREYSQNGYKYGCTPGFHGSLRVLFQWADFTTFN